MASSTRRWTEKDREDLRRLYPEYGGVCHRWECNGGNLIPGKSRNSIVSMASHMGIKCRYRGPHDWTHAQNRMALQMLATVCRETGKSPYEVLGHLRSIVQNNQRGYRSSDFGA